MNDDPMNSGQKPKNSRRRGWLKNGNPPGDFTKAVRCGAKNRRGMLCRAPAMRNGRCRLHGGLSTGPKTWEGIERIREVNTKHGRYRRAARESRRRVRALARWTIAMARVMYKKQPRV